MTYRTKLALYWIVIAIAAAGAIWSTIQIERHSDTFYEPDLFVVWFFWLALALFGIRIMRSIRFNTRVKRDIADAAMYGIYTEQVGGAQDNPFIYRNVGQTPTDAVYDYYAQRRRYINHEIWLLRNRH